MKKINILEITNKLGIGGTEKTMQIFIKYLSKSGYSVYVCDLYSNKPQLKRVKGHVRNIFIGNSNIDNVIKFIKDKNINVVHYHNILRKKSLTKWHKSDILRILKYCRENSIKVIETSPFTDFDAEIDKLIDIRLFVSKTALLKFYFKNKKSKLELKYGFLYNPIDSDNLRRYVLSKNKIKLIRRKYGIREEDFVIGRVGRADIWKWSDEIIDAVPYLIKKIPNLKVVIRAIPKQKIQEIKKKHLLKHFILLPESARDAEIYYTYQLMNLLLHTSRIGESFGVALAEAMYFGLPVITNSTDFMQPTIFDRDNGQIEIVQNGKNGFIENDLNGMVNKIIFLYKNKKIYKSISVANTIKAKKMFDPSKIVKKFEKLISRDKIKIKKINLGTYQKIVIKNSFSQLIQINSKALYEYIKYIKFVPNE